MIIIADENIPLADTFFSSLGKVETLPGREMTREAVAHADALLVRSVTSVNSDLLQNTNIKFVGTATIGVDHIDQDFLEDNQIGFKSAPGCNAMSVTNYVISVLNHFAYKTGENWLEKRVGVIGCGNVGKTLVTTLQSIGCEVITYDPFLDEGDWPLAELDEVLSCDVICMHTPYTKTGPFPTHHMIGEAELEKIKPTSWLINAGRGPAIDNQALKLKLQQDKNVLVALDVWENEPSIDLELMQLVDIATPHIAGYSMDGKMAGTEMIYQGLCQHFGLPVRLKLAQLIPEPGLKLLSYSDEIPEDEAVRLAIKSSYDVVDDDLRTRRQLLSVGSEQVGKEFDQLRKHYPKRRDFNGLRIQLKQRQQTLVDILESLGFKVKS